jgi:hypothetical protein
VSAENTAKIQRVTRRARNPSRKHLEQFGTTSTQQSLGKIYHILVDLGINASEVLIFRLSVLYLFVAGLDAQILGPRLCRRKKRAGAHLNLAKAATRAGAREARNKATVAIEALLENKAEPLARKAIDLALGGNILALRLCLERLCPPRRDRGVAFDLPKIESAADALAASHAVLDSCAAGPCRRLKLPSSWN